MSHIRRPAPLRDYHPTAPLSTLATRVFWAWSGDVLPYRHEDTAREIAYHVATLRGMAYRCQRAVAALPDGPEQYLERADAVIWTLRADAWEVLTRRHGNAAAFRSIRTQMRQMEILRETIAAHGVLAAYNRQLDALGIDGERKL